MREIHEVAQKVLHEAEKIIVGKTDKIKLIIMAVLADGHLLLDDLPGETLKMATATVATGPIILLYPFVQKYFVAGLTVGSVKG